MSTEVLTNENYSKKLIPKIKESFLKKESNTTTTHLDVSHSSITMGINNPAVQNRLQQLNILTSDRRSVNAVDKIVKQQNKNNKNNNINNDNEKNKHYNVIDNDDDIDDVNHRYSLTGTKQLQTLQQQREKNLQRLKEQKSREIKQIAEIEKKKQIQRIE